MEATHLQTTHLNMASVFRPKDPIICSFGGLLSLVSGLGRLVQRPNSKLQSVGFLRPDMNCSCNVLPLNVQSTKTWGICVCVYIYSFSIRNRDTGFGSMLRIWVLLPRSRLTKSSRTK